MTFIERLASGIEIVHEGPPPEVHGGECWRVHLKCAVMRIEAYEAALAGYERRQDGPEDVAWLLRYGHQRVRELTTRVAELERRLGDVCR